MSFLKDLKPFEIDELVEVAFKNSNKFSTTIITSPSHGNHLPPDKVFHPGIFPYLDNARQDNAPHQGICHIL